MCEVNLLHDYAEVLEKCLTAPLVALQLGHQVETVGAVDRLKNGRERVGGGANGQKGRRAGE